MEFWTSACAPQDLKQRALDAGPDPSAPTEAWLSERGPVHTQHDRGWTLKIGPEGVFGRWSSEGDPYASLQQLLHQNSEWHLCRLWTRAPSDAFAGLAAMERALHHPAGALKPPHTRLPATSTSVAFFATFSSPVLFNNLRREPASADARGALLSIRGQRVLLTGPIAGDDPEAPLWDQLEWSIDRARNLISQFNLKDYGVQIGFGLEDLRLLRVYHHANADRPFLEHRLRRILPPDAPLSFVQVDNGPAVMLEGVLVKKGESVFGQKKYRRDEDGRVRVEAFELHVVEHCNLRCKACCNMSPYLAPKTLSVQRILSDCASAARHLRADVFKIMGGEPLLHPDITALLNGLRETGISDTIRLFTNGLLLRKMPDAFWEALDHLTISEYASAPLKPAIMERVQQKVRAFDVVLNHKRVDRFNLVMKAEATEDPREVIATYDDCWLRHRCLVVREGRFYKCTRAAYLEDFSRKILKQADDGRTPMLQDGLPLDAPDFGDRVLEYLNRDTPLNACARCHGGSGPLIPHTQLSKLAILEGAL